MNEINPIPDTEFNRRIKRFLKFCWGDKISMHYFELIRWINSEMRKTGRSGEEVFNNYLDEFKNIQYANNGYIIWETEEKFIGTLADNHWLKT